VVGERTKARIRAKQIAKADKAKSKQLQKRRAAKSHAVGPTVELGARSVAPARWVSRNGPDGPTFPRPAGRVRPGARREYRRRLARQDA
jgi:hypothetical protein